MNESLSALDHAKATPMLGESEKKHMRKDYEMRRYRWVYRYVASDISFGYCGIIPEIHLIS